MSRQRRRRHDRISIVALTLLAAAGVFVARAVYDEWQVKRVQAGELHQLSFRQDESAALDRLADRADLPPRASLMLAEILARDAYAQDSRAKRDERLAMARNKLAEAMAARPDWGDAEIARSFIAFVQYGIGAPATRAALARSYDHLRFSRRSGVWRVRLGIQEWAALDGGMRQRVIEEAVWLGNLSVQQDALMRSIVMEAPEAMPVYFETRRRYALRRA